MHQILNLQLSSNFTEAGLQINFVNFNLKRPINKMQAAGSRKRKFQRFGFDDTNTIRGACGALPTQFFFLHNPHNTPKSYHETKESSLQLSVFKRVNNYISRVTSRLLYNTGSFIFVYYINERDLRIRHVSLEFCVSSSVLSSRLAYSHFQLPPRGIN